MSIAVSGPTLSAGATGQFKATATMSDGTTQDVTSAASWTSSNTAVATITEAGLVTAISDGSTTITATYQSESGNSTETVIG